MTTKTNPLAVRAQEILHEQHTDGSLIDRENLAIRIARMEQRDAAVAELVEASTTVWSQCRNGQAPDLIALADALNAFKDAGWKRAALAAFSEEA